MVAAGPFPGLEISFMLWEFIHELPGVVGYPPIVYFIIWLVVGVRSVPADDMENCFSGEMISSLNGLECKYTESIIDMLISIVVVLEILRCPFAMSHYFIPVG